MWDFQNNLNIQRSPIRSQAKVLSFSKNSKNSKVFTQTSHRRQGYLIENFGCFGFFGKAEGFCLVQPREQCYVCLRMLYFFSLCSKDIYQKRCSRIPSNNSFLKPITFVIRSNEKIQGHVQNEFVSAAKKQPRRGALGPPDGGGAIKEGCGREPPAVAQRRRFWVFTTLKPQEIHLNGFQSGKLKSFFFWKEYKGHLYRGVVVVGSYAGNMDVLEM